MFLLYNTAPVEKQQIRISNIIKKKYNQERQFLNLNIQNLYWADVLQFQNWRQLKQLSLSNCQITDFKLSAIASLQWPHLQKIDLQCNKVTSQGIKQFIKNNLWPKLLQLDLSCNNISDDGIEVILKRQLAIQHLQIANCKITAQGLRQICNGNLIRLKYLHLADNNIGNNGIKYLIKANLPQLQTLWLYNCNIGRQGIKHLTKSDWPKLQCLGLGKYLGSQNYDKGMEALVDLGFNSWSKLNSLTVYKEIPPISAMSLIAINWPSQLQLNIQIQNLKLEKHLREIVKSKFK